MPLRVAVQAFVAGCIVLIAPTAPAQAPAAPAPVSPVAFEVATIKPSARPGKFPWNEQPALDGMGWTNVSLQYLVREAYGVTDDKRWSGGPAWLDTQRFDIVAKFDASATPAPTFSQRTQALQALLADRFALKLHTETKDFPVYNLVIAKDGPKLTETKPEDIHIGMTGAPVCFGGRNAKTLIYTAVGCRPGDLDNLLRYESGRTVIDKTGLTARYSFELHWTSDNTPADSPNASGPSIFTAVQEQLGLKLEPATAALEVFVIDSAEMPTPN